MVYGLEIRDSSQTIVTRFATESVLREVARGYFSSPSNVQDTTAGTVPSGVTMFNSILVTTCVAGGGGWQQNNVAWIDGTTLKVTAANATTTTRSGRISVLQYEDATPGVDAYGLYVKNTSGSIVLDAGSFIYMVRGYGSISGSGANWTSYGLDNGECMQYHVLSLPATYSTVYPFAVACRSTVSSEYTIMPYIFANNQAYYQEVIFHRPYGSNAGIDYYFLTGSNNTAPLISSSEDYGLQIWDGSLQYDSRWRQAIVQDIVYVRNTFNGIGVYRGPGNIYNWEHGYDGCFAPAVPEGGTGVQCRSQPGFEEEPISITDSANSYFLFNACSGRVNWYQCKNEGGTWEGGGQHWPSIKILSNSEVRMKMHRATYGIKLEGSEGQAYPDNHIPQGKIAIVRII